MWFIRGVSHDGDGEDCLMALKAGSEAMKGENFYGMTLGDAAAQSIRLNRVPGCHF